jgi:filamentous hemagglutinin
VNDANALGTAWVGENYQIASDGKTLISENGLRQYRPPTYKPNLNRYQADLEQRLPGQVTNQWFSNGHLDITDLPC